MLKKVIVGAIIALSMTGVSLAGGYGNRIVASPYVQNVDVKQKRVEFDSRYFLGIDGYYAVGEQIKHEKETTELDEVRRQNEILKAQLDVIIKLLGTGNGNAIPLPVNPNPPTPAEEPEPATPAEQPADGAAYVPTALDKQAFDIFSASCKKCHSEGPNDNGLTLITKNGALRYLDAADRFEVYNRVQGTHLEEQGKARMPKGSAALGDDKVKSLYLWLAEEVDRIRS